VPVEPAVVSPEQGDWSAAPQVSPDWLWAWQSGDFALPVRPPLWAGSYVSPSDLVRTARTLPDVRPLPDSPSVSGWESALARYESRFGCQNRSLCGK